MAPTILLAALLLVLAASPARADVVLDGSFGFAGPVPQVLETPGPPEIIDNVILESFGRLEDRNLFHSFSEFSVPENQIATFSALSPVNNVIARVTGGDASAIEGKLRSTINGAALYLLNPHGVIFGPESSLDLPGSFYVSTADVLVFPDLEWPTGQPGAGLLSAAPPSAFGFLSDQPASIEFEGARLSVPEGSTLSAVGGRIEVAGRTSATIPALRALGGRVQLASVAASAEVPIDIASLEVTSFEDGVLGDVSFTQRAVVDVSSGAAQGSGTVVIRGGRFCMGAGPACDGVDSSRAGEIRALTADVEGSSTAIDIQVTGDLLLDSRALVQSGSAGAARSGDILLAGKSVQLTGGATVGTSTAGSAASGDVHVEADELDMSDSAQLLTLTFSSGGAGKIEVTSGSVDVRDRAQIATLSQQASGAPGHVSVEAARVELSQRGQIAVESSRTGPGGRIDVRAQTLSLTSEAKISSLSDRNGGGSAIHIESGQVSVTDGAQIGSETRGSQTGGKVELVADELSVTNGGQVTTLAAASATGRGGDLEVEAAKISVSTGDLAPVVSQIGALTESQNGGAGGNLTVDVGSIELRDGGQIRTTTTGTGQSGELVIRATDTVHALGTASVMGEDGEEQSVPSGIFARSAKSATGDGGRLFIAARVVELENAGEISARTFGDAGAAGDLEISAERVVVSGGEKGASIISARGEGGDGGELKLTTDVLELTSGGSVTASTRGTGDSGDLRIEARQVLISGVDLSDPEINRDRSGVFAQTNARPNELMQGAVAGDAGDITLTASESLEILDGGRISVATRGDGSSGNVTILDTPVVKLSGAADITAQTTGRGDAGSIAILDAGEVTLSDGAAITAQTTDRGDAGSITIVSTGDIVLSGSTITTQSEGSGEGGSITIATAKSVLLSSGAKISAQTTVSGALADFEDKTADQKITLSAGSIEITAGASFDSSNSLVTTEATATEEFKLALLGDPDDPSDDIKLAVFGGNIDIHTTHQTYALLSEVTTSVETGDGDGGNITMDPRFVVLNKSTVRANAFEGNGGNILIAGDEVVISSNTIVDASSELGISGTVQISAPDTDLSTELVTLPATFLDASSLLRQSCSARTARAGSLVVRGRDRIPAPPDAPLRGFYPGGHDASPAATSGTPAPDESDSPELAWEG